MQLTLSNFRKEKNINDYQSDKIVYLSPYDIIANPAQPRKMFDDESISRLAESIREFGLLSPLCVSKTVDGKYILIAGERRLRAAQTLDMERVPCVLVNASGSRGSFMSLIENLQRENLSFFEEAEGYCRLISEFGLTETEIARRIGISQSTVANKIRLLKLPRHVRLIITQSDLTERHARALLKVEDQSLLAKIAIRIGRDSLNVRETEELIKKLTEPKPVRHSQIKFAFRDMRIFRNTITKAVETIRRSGLEADCKTFDEDDRIRYEITIPK